MSDHAGLFNAEAEAGVIGAVLLDPSAMHEVAGVLEPDDFFRDDHAELYRAARELYDAGKPFDAVAVSEDLGRRKRLEAIGGFEAVADFAQRVPHAANAGYHAGIVRQKAALRRLMTECQDTVRLITSNTLTASEVYEQHEARVLTAGDRLAGGETATLGRASRDVIEAARLRQDTKSAPGVMSGITDLDDLLDGMKPERLYVLAARPSHGKSALALNVAAFASVDAGIPSRYVSLEMGRDELAERYLAGAASVDGTYIRKGKLTRDDYLMLEVAAENADARAAMVIDDEPSQTLFAIGARARRQKARHGLGLLVIDYLQLIDGQPRKGESREQEVSRISRRLKSLAKELKIPVLACCQVNRLAEAREDRRPRVADLRESGSIEQDADVVMLLHRPEQHDPNDRAGEAELVVAKHRGGPTGTVKLAFDKRYTRFAALAQRIEPPVDYGDEPF